MAKLSKLLVVAAWEPELARFREHLAARGGPPEGLEIALSALGVGLVEAAREMTRCVVKGRPDLALLLGTCGILPGASLMGIGDVVVASSLGLVEGGIMAGTSQLPAPMPAEVSPDRAVHDALVDAGARSVRVANTLAITVDDGLAARIAAAGYDVEHLEAFAFARVCAASGVRSAVVLGIANVVGSNGRAEWSANHASASADAADVAWRARGALGALAAQLRTSTRGPSPERA